jgi:hypothetical protein
MRDSAGSFDVSISDRSSLSRRLIVRWDGPVVVMRCLSSLPLLIPFASSFSHRSFSCAPTSSSVAGIDAGSSCNAASPPFVHPHGFHPAFR